VELVSVQGAVSIVTRDLGRMLLGLGSPSEKDGAGAGQPTPTSTAQHAGGTAPAPQPGAAPSHTEGAGRLDTHAPA